MDAIQTKAVGLVAAALLAFMLTACASPAPVPSPPVESQPPPEPVPVPAPDTPPAEEPGRTAYQEALELIGAGKYREAEARLEEILQQEPGMAEAWNDLAFVRLKNYSDRPTLPGRGLAERPAIMAAERALAIRPGWAFAQYNLGVARLANGEYLAAVEPLHESARQQPDRVEPLVALGLALMGSERFDEAAAACRQALALDPAYKLATACLDQLADGGARHPISEAAIGAFRWDPVGRNFRWEGAPEEAPAHELSRTSPPWTCADAYANGFRKGYVDCWRDPWYYHWGGRSLDAGTTPAGVGVGTPVAEVIRLYGEPRRNDNRLFYRVGDLALVFQLDAQEQVTWFYFATRTPYFLIDDLLRE